MMHAMRHRGLDDEGMQWVNDPSNEHPSIALLHRRLSIIDLSKCGHQPMLDAPTDAHTPPNWITYNGEIFNYLELHDELARAGWPCRTRSDTEVILHAYRAWGDECVHRLNGMFAWCLVDSTRRIAWFCRDRLGVKPLYLYRPGGGGLLFASEVRTLLAAGEVVVPPVVSQRALEGYLAQGAVYGDETIVRNVQQLGPGESLITDWSGREVLRRKYWSIPPPAQTDDTRGCDPYSCQRSMGPGAHSPLAGILTLESSLTLLRSRLLRVLTIPITRDAKIVKPN